MNKTIHIALASTAALALAACGGSTDASEEAMADTVEMPADDALSGTPEPVADAEAVMDDAEVEATAAADAAEDMVADQIEDQIETVTDEVEAITE